MNTVINNSYFITPTTPPFCLIAIYIFRTVLGCASFFDISPFYRFYYWMKVIRLHAL